MNEAMTFFIGDLDTALCQEIRDAIVQGRKQNPSALLTYELNTVDVEIDLLSENVTISNVLNVDSSCKMKIAEFIEVLNLFEATQESFQKFFVERLFVETQKKGARKAYFVRTGSVIFSSKHELNTMAFCFDFDIVDQMLSFYIVHFGVRGREISESQVHPELFIRSDSEYEEWNVRRRLWRQKHSQMLNSEELREYMQMEADFYAWLLNRYGDSILRWARERFGLPPEP